MSEKTPQIMPFTIVTAFLSLLENLSLRGIVDAELLYVNMDGLF